MAIFSLNSLNRETLKYILREGARTNNVLRLNDHCFEIMIDSLGLPLDDDIDNSQSYQDHHASQGMLQIESKSGLSKQHEENPDTQNSCISEQNKDNKFIRAKDLLSRIYSYENDIYYGESGTNTESKSKDHAVAPINIDPAKEKELVN